MAERDAGYLTDEDTAVPATDPTNTTELLAERLQAWKHMCGYLENYISEVSKDEKKQAKDQEKILKTLSHPLREGHHFAQELGGVAGLFENMRANTQAQANMHTETSSRLTGAVLPILERLHKEIKNKSSELAKGAGKGSKAVDEARNRSQKHIELLGQHTGTVDARGGKVTAQNDPYVIHRQVHHHLNKQLMAENSNRQDLIEVQNSFQQFEAHVLTTVQNVLNSFNMHMSAQADRQKAIYGDIASTAGSIPLDFEWHGFVKRSGDMLINPNAAQRSMSNISFPNQNHRSTVPLVEGTLERKGRGVGALSGYKSGHYVVTGAGYLHEYKDNDNFGKHPEPEISLYLPDCVIGALDGPKFAIKGKDTSGSKLLSKMAPTFEYNFKAHSSGDAEKWHAIISSYTSGTSNSVPTSPISSNTVTPVTTNYEEKQQQGVIGGPQSGMSSTPGGAQTTMPIREPRGGVGPTAGTANQGVATQHFQGAPGGQPLGDRKY